MNNKKYYQIAVGWLKQGKDGSEYVSASANGKSTKVKLLAQLENGQTVEVNSFAMFFNKNKKKDSHPDVQFSFTTED